MILRYFSVLLVAAGALGQSRPAADSRPATESQPVLAPGDPAAFAPLFRFCPANVESVMLVTAAALPESLKDYGIVQGDFAREATFKCVRAFQAARKFSERWDYEGIRAFELEKPVSLADVLNEHHFSYESIAGIPCFVKKPQEDEGDWGPLEHWITVVDRKYMIFATRRAVLKEVLAGKGPGPEIVIERLGWKSADVAWGAPITIVRKFAPDKKRTSPIERLCFAHASGATKGRLDVVAKDSATATTHVRNLLGDRRSESRSSEEETPWGGMAQVEYVRSDGDRHVFTVTAPKKERVQRDEDEEERGYVYAYDWGWQQAMNMLYGTAGF